MDTIWIENPSKLEVIGRFGGDEKHEWPRKTDKSRSLKKSLKKSPRITSLHLKYCEIIEFGGQHTAFWFCCKKFMYMFLTQNKYSQKMNLTCILVVSNKCQQEQIIELFWKVVWCNVSIRIACKWLQFSYLSKLKPPSEHVREKREVIL